MPVAVPITHIRCHICHICQHRDLIHYTQDLLLLHLLCRPMISLCSSISSTCCCAWCLARRGCSGPWAQTILESFLFCCRMLTRHSAPLQDTLISMAILLLTVEGCQECHLSEGSSSVKSWKARYLRSWELASRLPSTQAHSACSAGELTSPLLARVPSSICIVKMRRMPP